MDEQPNMAVTYQARREARSGDKPVEAGSLRRKFIIGTVVLLLVILLTVAGIVAWSYTRVTTVRAQVVTDVVTLATEVDVRMHKLLVHPGQAVKKGDVLARLDDDELQAAVQAAEAGLAIERSLLARAQATLRYTREKVNAEVALAEANVLIARARLAKTRQAFDQRKARLPEEIGRAEALLQQAKARLDQLEKGATKEELEAARVALKTARAQADLARLEYRQLEQLSREGIESQRDLEVARTAMIVRDNQVRQAELNLARLTAGADPEQLKAARQAWRARSAELALAKLGSKQVDALAAEAEVNRAEVKQAEAELQQATAGKVQVDQAAESVHEAEARIRRAEAELAARRAALSGMTLTSPVDGTVIRTFRHEGEICTKGSPVILVADASAGWWIEGYVHESDASRLKLGQTARVETVVGSWDYIEAELTDVALATSSLSAPQSPGSAASRAAGELVWVKLKPLEPDTTLLPGMSARCVIRTGW